MRIGIDIDGVLTDVGQFAVNYFSKYCVENNIKYDINNGDYNVAVAFNVDDKYGKDFWKEYLLFYAEHEPARPFAAEIIKKLKQNGHEIYIITARWTTNQNNEIGAKMRETVKNWLAENDIVYDKLIFSKEDHERKNPEIADHEIDVMIEDNPRNIAELSSALPVICYDARYNQDCTGVNIIRVFSWYDIYDKIKEMNSAKKGR